MKKNPNFPPISVIILTRNSEKTLKQCLMGIKMQTYPSVQEVLLIDGGSKDATFSIAEESELPIRVIKGGYPTNQEARRAVGIDSARNDYILSLDSDNYILDKSWLKKMVEPFMSDNTLAASQTLRYAAPKNTDSINRYFGLFGAGDPVAYYLRKTDRLSWAQDTWNLRGSILSENKNYYIVQFDPNNYPTLGCNGLVFRKSIITKAHWNNPTEYFHTDVFVDIGRKGFNRFAIVKNEIYHHSSNNIISYFAKRNRYMQMHHQDLHRKRRYLVFDPKDSSDVRNLLMYMFFSTTLVVPLMDAMKGYLKKPDLAWFLHPIMCFITTCVYGWATFNKFRRSIFT